MGIAVLVQANCVPRPNHGLGRLCIPVGSIDKRRHYRTPNRLIFSELFI